MINKMSNQFFNDIFTISRAESGEINHVSSIGFNLEGKLSLEQILGDKFVFHEVYNRNKLAFVINNFIDMKSKISITRDKIHDGCAMSKYYLSGKCNKTTDLYYTPVKYHQDKDIYTRYQAEHSQSQQAIIREMKQIICEEYYYDVDMVNAHPSMIVWLCKCLDLECDIVKDYVANRDKHIADLIELNPGSTKSDFKLLFLRSQYGCGKKTFSFFDHEEKKPKRPIKHTEFVKNYYSFFKSFSKTISDLFPELFNINSKKRDAEGKDYNYEGSCLSQLMLYIECQCLLRMINLLKDNDKYKHFIKYLVLCFDGFMIRKSVQYRKEIILDCETLVFEINQMFKDIGIPDVFVDIKVMSDHPELMVDYDEKEEYTVAKTKFVRKQPVKAINSVGESIKELNGEANTLCVNHFIGEDKFYLTDFKMMMQANDNKTEAEALTMFASNIGRVLKVVNGMAYFKLSKDDKCSLNSFKGLDLDKSRIDYQVVLFDENGEECLYPKSCSFQSMYYTLERHLYNSVIFSRVSYKYDKEFSDKTSFYINEPFKANVVANPDYSKLDIMLNFIKEIYCEDKDEIYNYFMKWLAFMIQKPNDKSGKFVVLFGAEGSGKNTFTDWLCKYIFGSSNSNSNVVGMNELLNPNNGNMITKKFIVINEASTTKTKFLNDFDKLKALITEKRCQKKVLYHDIIDAKQSMEFILSSNHENCIHLDTRKEAKNRRYLMLKVSDRYAKDKSFFLGFRKTVFNQQFADLFYTYLLNYELDASEFKLSNAPMTKYKEEVLEANSSVENLYCDYLIGFTKRYNMYLNGELDDEDEIYEMNEVSNNNSVLKIVYDNTSRFSDKPDRFTYQTIVNGFIEFCKTNHINKKFSKDVIAKKIKSEYEDTLCVCNSNNMKYVKYL